MIIIHSLELHIFSLVPIIVFLMYKIYCLQTESVHNKAANKVYLVDSDLNFEFKIYIMHL